MGASVRVKYGIHPGPTDAPGTLLYEHLLLLLPRLDNGPANCQLTSEREAGPQRTSAVPLGILEVQSVDEKSKSAVTKLGLLPSTVLTVQSRKKNGGGGGLPESKQWDC